MATPEMVFYVKILIKLKYSKKEMLSMTMGIIPLVSIIIWIAVTYELSKPSEKQNKRNIITFTALGTLSTVILTISLFQNFTSF